MSAHTAPMDAAAALRKDQLRRHNGLPHDADPDASVQDRQLTQKAEPRPVFEPNYGFSQGAALLVVEDDALWLRAAIEGQAGNELVSERVAKANAHWDAVVVDLLQHIQAQGFVAAVQHDIAAILLQVKGERQKELEEGRRSKRHVGPQYKTTILSMPGGTGKTRAAQFLLRELGCCTLVDEWSPTLPITWGALHLTNIPPRYLPASVDGVRLLHCGFTEDAA